DSPLRPKLQQILDDLKAVGVVKQESCSCPDAVMMCPEFSKNLRAGKARFTGPEAQNVRSRRHRRCGPGAQRAVLWPRARATRPPDPGGAQPWAERRLGCDVGRRTALAFFRRCGRTTELLGAGGAGGGEPRSSVLYRTIARSRRPLPFFGLGTWSDRQRRS